MKSVLFVITSLLAFPMSFRAQVSPNPVINNEIKDNSSIRTRSIELEKVKRDANKLRHPETSEETEIRFKEIKDDFEGIQKLQSLIIKTYTIGVKINYEKIRELAFEMKKKAVRLDINFFNTIYTADSDKKLKDKMPIAKNVRDLIIELDKTIGVFVDNPIFKRATIVDSKLLEKSQKSLSEIIKLSENLSKVKE
jgi:hypothetical protein